MLVLVLVKCEVVVPLHINIEFMSVCYVRMEIVLRLSSCIS